MVDYASLAATAKRLIDENGRTVTIRQLGNAAADPNKPWRGAVDQTSPLRDSQSGTAVFVADKVRQGLVWSLAQEFVDGVKEPSQVCLYAAANDGGKNLEDFDEIVDGTTTWRIVRAEVLQPGDTRILYAFEVLR